MNNNKSSTATRIIVLVVILAAVWVWYTQNQAITDQNPIEPAAGGSPVTRPAPPPAAGGPASGQSADFDFYVLALSWSPDFCADTGDQDQQQCAIGRKLGFVLHGLWPQYDQGYPSNCSNVRLAQAVKSRFAGLYPNTSLFEHEWEKHGTCTGLTPDQYLSLSKRLKDSVVIPAAFRSPEQPIRTTSAQLKKDFVASNPAFAESSLAPYCSGSGRYLKELYLCYSPDGVTRKCSSEILRDSSRSCGGPDFLVRNVR